MRKYRAMASGAVVLLVIALFVEARGVNQGAGVGAGGVHFSSQEAIQTVVSAKADRTARDEIGAAAANKTVYFFPQDGPTTATVLILLNTSDQPVTATLVVEDNTSYNVSILVFEPSSMHRICSDRVPGWTDWSWIDFGTGAYVATLALPPSVVVDGYIVWNGSGDTYDPGAAVPRLPLRFLEEPLP